MKNIFKENTLNAIVFKLQLIHPTGEPESSYDSGVPWHTGLQFHYVIADPKEGEQRI